MEKELESIAKEPQVYEVGFHILPTVAEEDLGVRVTAVRDIIEGAGGKMISDEYPKHVELAYPMVKVSANKRAIYHSAYFGWMKFDADVSAAKKIDASFKKDEYILRFILVKTVRENTMVPKKVFREMKSEESGERVTEREKVEERPAMTEEELDKTIDDLVIS